MTNFFQPDQEFGHFGGTGNVMGKQANYLERERDHARENGGRLCDDRACLICFGRLKDFREERELEGKLERV